MKVYLVLYFDGKAFNIEGVYSEEKLAEKATKNLNEENRKRNKFPAFMFCEFDVIKGDGNE